ncbi:hypothetical protein BCR41DRAFT_351642, partial [Lobosporangium transversale]
MHSAQPNMIHNHLILRGELAYNGGLHIVEKSPAGLKRAGQTIGSIDRYRLEIHSS